MKKLEDMNEGWKSYTMISFGVSWYKWVEIVLNNEVVNDYMLIQLSENRNGKRMFNNLLYSEF